MRLPDALSRHAYLRLKYSMSLNTDCSCVTCDGRSHGHGHGHQAQQEADGLGNVVRPDQLEGNGGHDADKAAVEQPHQQAHSDQPAEDVAKRDHHGHDADDEEGGHLRGQQRGLVFTSFIGRFLHFIYGCLRGINFH